MKVLNKRNVSINAGVYIGRGSIWGNPFVIGKDGDRAEVIEKYKRHIMFMFKEDKEKEKIWLSPLVGKDLVCFCAPQACHGDVLLKMIGE